MATQLDLSTKPRANRAYRLAVKHHYGVKRKYTGEDYVEHPIRVAERLVSMGLGSSEDVIAAALLHDAVEDPNAAGEYMDSLLIENACGPRVRRWVLNLSKPSGRNRAARNHRYIQQLIAAPADVQQIKLADILDNVTGLAALNPGFADFYLDEKKEQAKALVNGALRDMVLDQITTERNALALNVLNMMREQQAQAEASKREIAAALVHEDRYDYAEYAIF